MASVAGVLSLIVGAAATDLCSDGLVASVHGVFVCCPKAVCPHCNELQCAIRDDDRCCPMAIYKRRAECKTPSATGCIFEEHEAYVEQMLEGAKQARARELLHSTLFCSQGIVGETVMGPAGGRKKHYAVCCPSHCGSCDEDSCARKESCCPRKLAARGVFCENGNDDACVVHRPELDVAHFTGAGPDESSSALVHVVVAGDRNQAPGVVASSRSVFESTRSPERIDLHVVVDPPSHRDIEASLRCAMRNDAGSRRITVHSFDVWRYARVGAKKNLTIRAPINEHKGNLAAGPNFARFYLAELLPRDIVKVVYLDADTIVLKDVAHLFETSLTSATPESHAIAAVSRKYKAMCGSFINCKSSEVRFLLRSQQIDDPETDLDAFNAGVMVIHLERWRAQRLTRQVEFWISWNADLPLYKLGSNPPLVLAVRDKFQHLDPRWNCQRSHTCWHPFEAGVMHWSGVNKPWFLNYKRDRVEWLPYLQGVLDDQQLDACLANLPHPGANLAPSDDDARALPSQVAVPAVPHVEERTRHRKRHGTARARNGFVQRPQRNASSARDAELLWPARDLVRRKPPADTIDDDDEFWRGRDAAVADSLAASLARYSSRRSPSELAAQIAELMSRPKSPEFRPCNYVVVAILQGELHVDTSRYGRDKRCGLTPGESVVTGLAFLAALGRDQQLDDALFVLCTDPDGPPLTLDVPVLTFAKPFGHQQPGILAPAPDDVTRRKGLHAHKADATTPHADRVVASVDAWSQAHREHSEQTPSWDQRQPRVAWRGRVGSDFTCLDLEAWARVEVATLTLESPQIFDARLTKKLDSDTPTIERCMEKVHATYPKHMRFFRRVLSKDVGTARSTPHLYANLQNYRFLYMLPDTRGCPDSDATAVWGLGAAILIWDAPCVKWYEPATQPGHTHLVVNFNVAKPVVTVLKTQDEAAQTLARRAAQFYARVLCPDCVKRYWADLIRRYRSHFRFDSEDVAALVAQTAGLHLVKYEAKGDWAFEGLVHHFITNAQASGDAPPARWKTRASE